MTKQTRSLVLASVLMALLILPAELVVIDVLQADGGPQGIANTWAKSLNESELQKAASSLLSYSVPYRKAVLARLPPDTRAVAWRGVHTTYIEEHPNLKPEQLSVLEQARDFISPKMYAPVPDRQLAKGMKVLGENVVKLMGDAALDPFFLVERDRNAPERSRKPERTRPIPPLWTRFKYFVAKEFVLFAAVDCNCYHDTQWNYCAAGMYCSELTGCTFQSWGCGFSQTWPCDGFCVLNS